MSIHLGVLRLSWRALYVPMALRKAPSPWLQRLLAASAPLWSPRKAHAQSADPHPADLKGDLFAQSDRAAAAPQIETVMLERFSCVTIKRADSCEPALVAAGSSSG